VVLVGAGAAGLSSIGLMKAAGVKHENTVIIDRDGVIAFHHIGYSEESLPGIVDEILSLLPDEVKSRPGGGQPSGSGKSSP